MAIQVNGFNIGVDASFAITDSYGDVFIDANMGYLEEFDSASEDVDLKITPITLGGLPIYQTLWNGIRGHMMFTRFGPTFQEIFNELQGAYYTAGVIPQFSLQLSVRNRDSSIDEYMYTGMQFTRPQFGNFRSTRQVDMRTEFRASQCITTSAVLPQLANVVALAPLAV